MIKEQSDSQRGNLLLPLDGLFFSISSSKGFQTGQHILEFLLPAMSTDRNEKELRDRSDDPLHHERTLDHFWLLSIHEGIDQIQSEM